MKVLFGFGSRFSVGLNALVFDRIREMCFEISLAATDFEHFMNIGRYHKSHFGAVTVKVYIFVFHVCLTVFINRCEMNF